MIVEKLLDPLLDNLVDRVLNTYDDNKIAITNAMARLTIFD
ncbi:hypothetical protein LGAA44_120018 [Leuconostoc gasicomitatum]|nr:hypothetical protein LGAA44_120018 [Leuconostoc gasicomitatum]